MNIKLTITMIIAALSAISLISIGNQTFAQNSANDQSIPFVVQNTSRSIQDPLPGHEGHQAVLAAPPRSDGKIYSGTVTFTASVPVEVVVLHNYKPINSTLSSDNQKYGEPLNAPFGNGKVAISLMKQFTGLPLNAGSFDFAGTALAFHTLDGKPFTVTYTIDADIDPLT
jgi:hypothetical protein